MVGFGRKLRSIGGIVIWTGTLGVGLVLNCALDASLGRTVRRILGKGAGASETTFALT